MTVRITIMQLHMNDSSHFLELYSMQAVYKFYFLSVIYFIFFPLAMLGLFVSSHSTSESNVSHIKSPALIRKFIFTKRIT